MSSKLSNLFTGIGCSTPILGFVLLGYLFYNRSFVLGIVALVVCILAGLLILGTAQQAEDKRKKTQMEFLQTFQPPQFDVTKHKSFSSYDLLSKIAIDDQHKKVHLWMPDTKRGIKVTKAYPNMPYNIRTYNFSDILAINLKEDNFETESIQRDTHFTNFLLNKLKEEAPATGNPTSQPVDKITSMDLEIIVDDNANPRHLIRFYYAPYTPLRKDSLEYEAHVKERNEWFTKLKTIIEQQNDHAPKAESPLEMDKSPIQAATSDPAETQEKTRITMEVDMDRYTLSFHDDPKDTSEVIPEITQDAPRQEQDTEKPKSYFEQLLEKNRRQLRGDYTDKEN